MPSTETKNKKWFKLQEWVAGKLNCIDPYCRSSKASGGSTEAGDLKNNVKLNVECKCYNKKNVWEIDWLKKCEEEIPLHSDKTAIVVTENKDGKKVVSLDADDFFDIYVKLYKMENGE